jgi:hypothetical protein
VTGVCRSGVKEAQLFLTFFAAPHIGTREVRTYWCQPSPFWAGSPSNCRSRTGSLTMWCMMSVPDSGCRVYPRPAQLPGPGAHSQTKYLELSLFARRIRSLKCGDRFSGRRGTKGSYWRMNNRVMVPRFRIPSLICGRERRCAKIEMFCFHVGTVSL